MGGVAAEASAPACTPDPSVFADVVGDVTLAVPAGSVVVTATVGPAWPPSNGTGNTPAAPPATVMVSAAVTLAMAILATDPNPANLAVNPARNPVPNMPVPLQVVRLG